jgi:hypothetical protein
MGTTVLLPLLVVVLLLLLLHSCISQTNRGYISPAG